RGDGGDGGRGRGGGRRGHDTGPPVARRVGRLRHGGGRDRGADPALDRDALVGVEVADPGRDVAGGHDLDGAPRRRPRGPDVAGRLVELEGGDGVDLRLLDRDGPLVAEGLPVDDLALPDPGEVVVDAVAGPARDRLVRVADPDLR